MDKTAYYLGYLRKHAAEPGALEKMQAVDWLLPYLYDEKKLDALAPADYAGLAEATYNKYKSALDAHRTNMGWMSEKEAQGNTLAGIFNTDPARFGVKPATQGQEQRVKAARIPGELVAEVPKQAAMENIVYPAGFMAAAGAAGNLASRMKAMVTRNPKVQQGLGSAVLKTLGMSAPGVVPKLQGFGTLMKNMYPIGAGLGGIMRAGGQAYDYGTGQQKSYDIRDKEQDYRNLTGYDMSDPNQKRPWWVNPYQGLRRAVNPLTLGSDIVDTAAMAASPTIWKNMFRDKSKDSPQYSEADIARADKRQASNPALGRREAFAPAAPVAKTTVEKHL
jgi:hypothetical protein